MTVQVVALIAADLLLMGMMAHAGTLTAEPMLWMGYQNGGGLMDRPSMNSMISVVPHGKTGYRGNAPDGLPQTSTNFDGLITDFRFFTEDAATPGHVATYASSGNGRLSDLDTKGTADMSSGRNWAVWTSTDPGPPFFEGALTMPYAAPQDFSTSSSEQSVGTSLAGKPMAIQGRIDISTLTMGRVYFFVGAYRNDPSLTLTMSGAGQPDLVSADLATDHANNVEHYVCSATFTNRGGAYDAITFRYEAGNGVLCGIVVTTQKLSAPPLLIN